MTTEEAIHFARDLARHKSPKLASIGRKLLTIKKDPRMLLAIQRLDRLEDAYNDCRELNGTYPKFRVSEKYCTTDLLDDMLYNSLMDESGGPPIRPHLT